MKSLFWYTALVNSLKKHWGSGGQGINLLGSLVLFQWWLHQNFFPQVTPAGCSGKGREQGQSVLL